MRAPPPTFSDITDAAAALSGRVVPTPLLAGEGVWFKAETLQRTGSFKFRGALNFLRLLDSDQRSRGVVAYSSGNHAQGVALAAALLGVSATIVMPEDAPEMKVRRTRAWGAEVVPYDRASGDREEVAARIAAARGAVVVPPYDHPWIIAGQGTVGLEIAEQCTAAGVTDPTVLVPASGGGLCAGVALALAERLPGAAVYTVEPAGFDDHRLSFEVGERRRAEGGGSSICDSLLTPIPGELTFGINQGLVAGGLAVTDDQVIGAMRWAFEELKLVVEPGGAAALAAWLEGMVSRDRPCVVVLSGGNVDPEVFASALRQGGSERDR